MGKKSRATGPRTSPPNEPRPLDFRVLFESAPGLFLVLTLDFKIAAVSDAYLWATMTRREDILGRGVFDVFPENPAEPDATGVYNLTASFQRVIQTRAPDTMAVQKYDIRRPASEGGDFEERYWLPVNSPVHDAGGAVAYILHKVEDVTEYVRLKQLESGHEHIVQQLRIHGEHIDESLRLLIEGTKDYAAFCTLDPRGHVVNWNPGAEYIKGYRTEEIIGQHYSRFFPEEDVKQRKPELALAIAATEGQFVSEGYLLRKNGSKFWASVVITALRDETVKVRGYSKITRDLTEKQQAETNSRLLLQEEATRKAAEEHAEEMWRRQEQWRVTLNCIGDGVVVTDSELRISLLNPVAQALTGWTADEAIGQPLDSVFRIVNAYSRQRVENSAVRALAEGVIVGQANDTLLISKDGIERSITDSAAPIRDEKGNVSGVVLVFQDHTAQREAERRIHDSEERFRKFMEHTPAQAWIDDEDGINRFANLALARELGRPLDQIIGKSVAEIMPGFAVADSLESDRQVIESGKPFQAIVSAPRHDGTIGRFLICKFHLGLSPDGRQQVGGVGIDITVQEQASEALRSSEERFRLMIESVKDYAIYSMDTRGTITSWNEGATRLFGYSNEEIIGQHRSLLFTSENVAAGVPQKELDQAAAAGKYLDEGWRIHKDGSRFWAQGSMSALYDSDGELQGFVKVLRDLSERKRSEESLALRDQAIEAVSQGIVITDPNLPDNPIIYASRGFERITGYRTDEIRGRNCRFLQGRETDPDKVAIVREAVGQGQPCAVELLNYRQDGTPFWNALSITPMRDDEGTLRHFVAVQEDVTKRRKMEQALHQSQKMEAVGRLVGGIAHDFNNLLTVILAACEFLASDDTLNTDSRELAQEISQAGERAAALIRQLMAFSRKQILQASVLSLNEVVSDTGKMLTRLIGEDVELTTTLSPGLWPVKVDRGQIEQVLVNLAVNARDAMPLGGKLTIETANLDVAEYSSEQILDVKPGAYVVLSVSDNGIGMNDEIESRVFEPFFTTKGPTKGTGLGLATVLGIVEQSGGRITVYSEPGLGTTFRIYFPKTERELDPGTHDHQRPAAVVGTETILVVEDDDSVRFFACRVLRSNGYNVLEAKTGSDALLIYQRHETQIQLMVTDVVMPDMSGRKISEQLLASRPDLKLLYMSGYTDDTVVRHGILEAQSNFIQKPFLPTAFAQKVRDILDGRC